MKTFPTCPFSSFFGMQSRNLCTHSISLASWGKCSRSWSFHFEWAETPENKTDSALVTFFPDDKMFLTELKSRLPLDKSCRGEVTLVALWKETWGGCQMGIGHKDKYMGLAAQWVLPLQLLYSCRQQLWPARSWSWRCHRCKNSSGIGKELILGTMYFRWFHPQTRPLELRDSCFFTSLTQKGCACIFGAKFQRKDQTFSCFYFYWQKLRIIAKLFYCIKWIKKDMAIFTLIELR